MSKKILLCLLAALCASAALSACGVRPKHLQPPEGATVSYPRSYPAADAE